MEAGVKQAPRERGAAGEGGAAVRGQPGAASARSRREGGARDRPAALTVRVPGREASFAGASLTFPGGRGGEMGFDRVVGGRMPR